MKTRQVTAVVECGTDDKYSVYIDDPDSPYGIIGTGATIQEAEADFLAGYNDMKSFVEESGAAFQDVDFIFKQ